MEKTAFRSPKGTLTHLKRLAVTHPKATGTLAGAGLGGTLGAGEGAFRNAHEKNPRKRKSLKRWAAQGALAGGITGFTIGAQVHADRMFNRELRQRSGRFGRKARGWGEKSRESWGKGGSDDPFRRGTNYRDWYSGKGSGSSREAASPGYKRAPTPDWLKGVTTKTEAGKRFRREAAKYHPDRNPGNKAAEEKFKDISSQWDNFQRSPDFKNMAKLKLGHVQTLVALEDEFSSIWDF